MSDEISNETLLGLHRRMVRIRRFEETAGKMMEDGKIPGALHLYVGEEAIASGVMAHLSNEDQITSTHRGHGHVIAKGYGRFKWDWSPDHPRPPATIPIAKPRRRPIRFMSSEAGIVVAMAARNSRPAGTVDSVGSGANARPTRAETDTTNEEPVTKIAWQAARSTTLRRGGDMAVTLPSVTVPPGAPRWRAALS